MLGRVAARGRTGLAPSASRVLLRSRVANDGGRRTILGGAFENEFEEARAKARRSRLRSFLAALDQLPSATQAQQEVQTIVSESLSEVGRDGFTSRHQLIHAVGTTQTRLAKLQTPASLKLELPLQNEDGSKQEAPGEVYSDKALPGDDEADKPPDVLTPEQQSTLVSMRSAAALEALPDLIDRSIKGAGGAEGGGGLVAQGGVVPLPAVLDAAAALCAAEPWARVGFHLRLQTGVADTSDVELIRSAAVAATESAAPFTRDVLLASQMLSDEEKKRLEALHDKAQVAKVITGEVRRRVMMYKAWHYLRPTLPAPKAPDALAESLRPPLDRATLLDRRDFELFRAQETDAILHTRLAGALFSYHDRLSTRRRRAINAVKYTCLFFALNILDFVITNL